MLGTDLRKHPSGYRDVGFVAEDSAVYDFLTARRFIEVNASLAGLPDPKAAAAKAIETVGLTDAADRTLEGFSKGMRQRAKVAAALVGEPQILILDEPLNGADPVQRAHLIDLFVTLGQAGKTVLVSSHVLHEVERMADRVIAMIDGRVAAAGTIRSLRALMTDIPRTVRIECTEPRTLGAALVARPFVDGVSIEAGTVHAQIADAAQLGQDDRRDGTELGCGDHADRTRGRVTRECLPISPGRLMRAFGTIFRLILSRLLQRRLGVLLALATLAPALVIALTGDDDPNGVFQLWMVVLFIAIAVPITGLLTSTAAFGEERRGATLPYLLVKPVPRFVVVAATTLAAAIATFDDRSRRVGGRLGRHDRPWGDAGGVVGRRGGTPGRGDRIRRRVRPARTALPDGPRWWDSPTCSSGRGSWLDRSTRLATASLWHTSLTAFTAIGPAPVAEIGEQIGTLTPGLGGALAKVGHPSRDLPGFLDLVPQGRATSSDRHLILGTAAPL